MASAVVQPAQKCLTHMYLQSLTMVQEYGGMIPFEHIEQIQRRAARYFLGVHRFAANEMVLGDVGWVILDINST